MSKTRAHRNGNTRNLGRKAKGSGARGAADGFSSEARAPSGDPDPTAMAKTRRKKRRTHLDQNAGRRHRAARATYRGPSS